jgi:hypothetical protein
LKGIIMELNVNQQELTELFLSVDNFIDRDGLTLTKCQLGIKLLTHIIQELEKTSNHSAIRRAYGDLGNYLKWQDELQN